MARKQVERVLEREAPGGSDRFSRSSPLALGGQSGR